MRVARSIFASSCFVASASFAQDVVDIPVERFRPAMSREGLIDVESAKVGEHFDVDVGVHLGYQLNPLVIYEDGARAGAIIAHRVHGNVMGAISLFEWVQLGLDIPVTPFQTGDTASLIGAIGAVNDPSFIGVGDMRFMPKVRVLREQDQFLDVAFIPTVTIPTGFPFDSNLGEGFFTFAPEVAASKALGPAKVAANLGYRFRPNTQVLDLVIGNELFFRGGAGVRLHDLVKIPVELDATMSFAGNPGYGVSTELPANTYPLEALLGAQVDVWGPLVAFGYGGVGIVGGYGAPDMRAGLGLRYAPRTPPDKDKDGIVNKDDACQDDPEDKDGYQDTDGCPDPDNDGDGVLDTADACANEAEDKDSFADDDGCPDTDNDGDGVADAEDGCPLKAGPAANKGCPVLDKDGDGVADKDDACPDKAGLKEKGGCPEDDRDRDGIKDVVDQCPDVVGAAKTAGCPDKDNDGVDDANDRCPDTAGPASLKGCPDQDKDGIADLDDKCPDKEETINGIEDTDGCPDKGKVLVVIKGDKIELKETVFFDPSKDTIQARSFPLLDQVALVMKAHPEIKKVRVVGHTDSDGNADANLDLSKRRAKAVVDGLIARGVESARLESDGFGASQPIADNKTKDGKAKNRRVELVVVEHD